MAKITITLYMAGTVNHATKNERLRLRSLHIWLVRSTMPRIMKWQRLLTLFIWHVMEREEKLRRREQYHARETAEERESRLEEHASNIRTMMWTEQRPWQRQILLQRKIAL